MITAQLLNRLGALKLKPDQMSGVLAIIAEILQKQEEAVTLVENRRNRDRERKRMSRGQALEIPRTEIGNSADKWSEFRGQTADNSADTPSHGFDGSLPSNSLPSLASFPSPVKKTPKGSKEKSPKAAIVFPSWCPPKLAEDYLALRKEKRAVRNQSVIDRIVKKCEEFQPNNPAAILEQSVNGNWVDVYELKGQSYAKPARTTAIHTDFGNQDYYGKARNRGVPVIGGDNASDDGSPKNGKLL